MALRPSQSGRAALAGAPVPGRAAACLSVLASGLVIGVLLVVMAISYAALVFSGPLGVHLQKGIGLNLLGAVVALTAVGLLSSLATTIAGPQDVTGAILGLAAASVAARMGPADSTFLTVVLVMGLSSVLTGALFLALGTFGVGDLIRYLPYPVVGGFLAGTGWLLVKGGIGIVTGVAPSLSSFDAYRRGDTALKLALVTGFAALCVVAARRYRHPLVIPIALGALVAGFYLTVVATGSSLTGTEAGGWLLGPFPQTGLWKPWALEALSGADWGQVRSEAATVISVVVVGALGLLLNSSGIEMATGQDLDLNRELRAAGAANLIVGATGTMPGYHKVSATVLAHALGARSRLVALVAAFVCGVTLVFGASAVSLFPRLALGGLVVFLGLSLLVEWVYDAWFRLRPVEYVLVVAILLVVAGVGFLAGVALGSAVAVVLFVVDSSRAEVVHAELTGATTPSNVDRAKPQRSVLQSQADAIHVLRLQGYLFFGTANRLLNRIRERARDASTVPLGFLVLDFRRVSGIDSSAVVSFVKASRLARSAGFAMVLTGLSPVLRRQLTRGGLHPDDGLQVLPDVDRGVQWCEDRILESHGADPPPEAPFLDLTDAATGGGALSRYLEELKVPEGHVLIREGDCSDELFLLESGRLTTLLEQTDGVADRLRTMGPGTVVGEVGMYAGRRRTASVVADAPSTLYRLSKEAMEALERDDPIAAVALHKMIAGVLAERLAWTLRSQRALRD